MEYRNCEEYVLYKLEETEDELYALKEDYGKLLEKYTKLLEEKNRAAGKKLLNEEAPRGC